MTVTFFERVIGDGQPVALFRLNLDEVKQEIYEDVWQNGEWSSTDRLSGYLFDGSSEVVRVTEREAMRDFPDAMVSRVAKKKSLAPIFVVKHLPHQHDQGKHGSGGTSVDSAPEPKKRNKKDIAGDDQKALELYESGKTWDQVAQEMGYANGGVARRAGMRHKERQTDKPEPTTPKPETTTTPKPEPVVAPTATPAPKPAPAPEPVTVTNPRPMTSDDPSQQLVPTDDVEVAKATGRPFLPFTTEGHSPQVVQTTKDLRDSQRASEQHFEQHFGAESRRRQKEYDERKALIENTEKEWREQNPHDRTKETLTEYLDRKDKAIADKIPVLGRSKASPEDIVADGLVDKVHLKELERLNNKVSAQYEVTRTVIRTDTAEHLLGAKAFDKPIMEYDYDGVRGADGRLPQKQRMDRDWSAETETSGPVYKPAYERVYIKPDGTEVASHARLFSDMSEHVDRRTYAQNVIQDTAKHRFEKITVLVTRQQLIDGDGDGKYNEAMKEQLRRQQSIVDSPNTHIVLHVPESAVGSIVSGGRFKSQLETGRSKGFKGKEFREGFEGSMVGVVHGDDKSKSLIYGALHTGGVQDSLAIAAEQYGRIGFVLKRSVHERSTFTDTDSLNSTSEASPLVGKQTTPNGHRHLGGVSTASPWKNDTTPEGKAEFDASLSRAPKKRESYMEAQVLGGVTLADIDHVTVPRGTKFPDTARRKLAKLGIPIVEYDVDGIAPPRVPGTTIEDSGAYAFDPKGAWGPIPLPTAKAHGFIVDILKHLPHQHDQQTHGNGGSSSDLLKPTDDIEVAKATGRPYTRLLPEGASPAVKEASDKYLASMDRFGKAQKDLDVYAKPLQDAEQKRADEAKARIKERSAKIRQDGEPEYKADARASDELRAEGKDANQYTKSRDDLLKEGVENGTVPKALHDEYNQAHRDGEQALEDMNFIIRADTAAIYLGGEVRTRTDGDEQFWDGEGYKKRPKIVHEVVLPDGKVYKVTKGGGGPIVRSQYGEDMDLPNEATMQYTARYRSNKYQQQGFHREFLASGTHSQADVDFQLKIQQGIVDSPNTRIVIHAPVSAVGGILTQGRFRSQLETGRSKGLKDKGVREGFEAGSHGVIYGEDKSKATIYGALHVGGVHAPEGVGAEQYGEVSFVLKKSTHERATFTEFDSLSVCLDPSPLVGKQTVLAGNIGQGGMGRINERHFDRDFPSPEASATHELSLAPRKRDTYREAQVYGGVSLADIDYITVPKGVVLPAATRKKIDKAGIKIVEYDYADVAPKIIGEMWAGDTKSGTRPEFDKTAEWSAIPEPTAKQRGFFVDIWKHLTGQHDQQSHGGGGPSKIDTSKSEYGGPFKATMTDEGFDVDELGMVNYLESQKSAHSKVTKDEAGAVSRYQAEPYYEEINGGLRMRAITGDDGGISPENQATIKKVDSAIAKSSFTEDVTTFRGVQDDEGYLQNMQVGDSFSDVGYASTSLNPILATGFALGQQTVGDGAPVLLRIQVRAGKPALAADPAVSKWTGSKDKSMSEEVEMQGYSLLNEVLLPRGASFTVTGRSEIDGVTVLDVNYE